MKLRMRRNNKKSTNNEWTLPITYPENSEETIFKGENGKYRMTFRTTPINADLMTTDQIENVVDMLSQWLGFLKGRCQMSLISKMVDLSPNIQYHKQVMMDADSDLDVMILQRSIDHFEELSSKANKVIQFYITIESPFNNLNSSQSYLEKTFYDFTNSLEMIQAFPLTCREHYELTNEILNPASTKKDVYSEQITPDYVEYKNEYFKVQNKYYNFFYLTNYEQHIDMYRALKQLFKLKKEAHISIIMNPKDKSKMQKGVKDDREFFKTMAGTKKEDAINEYEDLKESAEIMLKEMGKASSKWFDVSIVYGLSTDSEEDIENIQSDGESVLQIAECAREYNTKRYWDCMKMLLPICDENKSFDKYCWNMDNSLIASFIPFDSSEFMHPKGILLGKNLISGGINTLFMHDPDFLNRHMSIIATPGAGKTTFLKALIDRLYPFYDHVVLIDLKGDLIFPYGKRYPFTVGSGIITNVFHISSDTFVSESGEIEKDIRAALDNKIIEIVESMEWIIDDMNSQDKKNIEDAIYKAYEKKGITPTTDVLPKVMPTYTDFMHEILEKLNDATLPERTILSLEKIRDSIEVLTNGSQSSMFNGQQNWSFDSSKMTILDLSKTKKAIQQYLYDNIIKTFWDMAIKNGSINPPKILFVADELHVIANKNKPQTLEFTSTYISKLGRGFGIDFLNATQNLPDFYALEDGQKIIDNSFFKCIMALGPKDMLEAEQIFELSAEEKKYIKMISANKGKGIFFVGSHKITNGNIMSKEQAEWIMPVEYQRMYGKKSRYVQQRDSE